MEWHGAKSLQTSQMAFKNKQTKNKKLRRGEHLIKVLVPHQRGLCLSTYPLSEAERDKSDTCGDVEFSVLLPGPDGLAQTASGALGKPPGAFLWTQSKGSDTTQCICSFMMCKAWGQEPHGSNLNRFTPQVTSSQASLLTYAFQCGHACSTLLR